MRLPAAHILVNHSLNYSNCISVHGWFAAFALESPGSAFIVYIYIYIFIVCNEDHDRNCISVIKWLKSTNQDAFSMQSLAKTSKGLITSAGVCLGYTIE